MVVKLAAGAILGFIAGHFFSPGYPLWVLIGLVLGYGADVLHVRLKEAKKVQN